MRTTAINTLIEGLSEVYNWPRRDYDAEPFIQIDHVDGPRLVTTHGDCEWLTWWERLQLHLGWIDAQDLQNKFYADTAKFTARVVMEQPIGHVACETLRKTADNNWKAVRGQHAFLWTAHVPPARAIVPVYAGEVTGIGAVELTRWDHFLIALGWRTPTGCVLKALRKEKKRLDNHE